jgi:hypothetical protein
LVPKSVFIELSIHSSIDDGILQCFNNRVTRIPAAYFVDLKSIFDTAFPNVKIRPISRVIRGGNKNQLRFGRQLGQELTGEKK